MKGGMTSKYLQQQMDLPSADSAPTTDPGLVDIADDSEAAGFSLVPIATTHWRVAPYPRSRAGDSMPTMMDYDCWERI